MAEVKSCAGWLRFGAIVTIGAAWFAVSAPAVAGGPVFQDGARIFGLCKNCHAVGETARAKIGPRLDGVVGRPAASLAGFSYSGSMKKAGEDGVVWDAGTLAAFLRDPGSLVPGACRSFRGLEKLEDREKLVSWLAELGPEAKGNK